MASSNGARPAIRTSSQADSMSSTSRARWSMAPGRQRQMCIRDSPLPRAGIDSAVGPDKAKGLIKSGGLVQRGGGKPQVL